MSAGVTPEQVAELIGRNQFLSTQLVRAEAALEASQERERGYREALETFALEGHSFARLALDAALDAEEHAAPGAAE